MEDCVFIHTESYGYEIFARSVSSDLAWGYFGLPRLLAASMGYLFYLADFHISPFGCQVGLSHFCVSAPFLVVVC